MRDFKIDNKGSARLFSNKFLERLTRTHFLIPVLLYYFIGILCLGYCLIILHQSWRLLILSFFSGYVFFTLIEYLIHRFIFHFNAVTPGEEQIQYNIHGVHHEFPRDKDRLVMPPVLSVTIAILFYFIFRLLPGSTGLMVFAGFVSGYSSYLLIHYFIHARKPPANFLKYLWTHHSLHHYHSEKTAFSVSFPLWDYLFGTMPDKNPKKAGHSQSFRQDSV